MLKIKHSRIDNSWIVYNPQNFNGCHTHTKYRRVALKLRWIAEHHVIPKSKDIRFIDSLIRITKNRKYLAELKCYKNLVQHDMKNCEPSRDAKSEGKNE